MTIELSRTSANEATVAVGDTLFLFSYSTCVAVRIDGEWKVSENMWGPTTGKHMNRTGVPAKDRMPRNDFLRLLNSLNVAVMVTL